MLGLMFDRESDQVVGVVEFCMFLTSLVSINKCMWLDVVVYE